MFNWEQYLSYNSLCNYWCGSIVWPWTDKGVLELEIDSVRKVSTKKKQRTGLQVLMFGIGILAVIESRIEDTTGDRGLIENFFVDGLLGLFGPFLLWIGGALILGRIAAFVLASFRSCLDGRRS